MNPRGVAALAALLVVAGCAGPSVLRDPVAGDAKGALAHASDSRVAATLDAVIVPRGPGTWVTVPSGTSTRSSCAPLPRSP